MEVDTSTQSESSMSHQQEKVRIPWLAVFLIVLGSILLLKKLQLIRISYSEITWSVMMLFGLYRVVRGFSYHRRWKVISGTSMFLFGLFFFLSSFESLDLSFYMLPSVLFLIAGIALLMGFMINVRDLYMLVPSLVFAGIGAALLLAEFGYLSHWEVWDAVHLYWPVIIILIGLVMILRRRFSEQPSTSQPTAS